jgi:hypothetical protein
MADISMSMAGKGRDAGSVILIAADADVSVPLRTEQQAECFERQASGTARRFAHVSVFGTLIPCLPRFRRAACDDLAQSPRFPRQLTK